MNQKEEIIRIYQKEDIAKTFDPERYKYSFQKYKHFIESKFLIETLRMLKSKKIKVLDVACGTGRMLDALKKSQRDIDYTGLDTSKAMTKILNDKAKKLGIPAKLKIGDATDMPFEDNSFDVVYTYHLTWHLPNDLQEKIIREMLRVVKKEGYIIFDVLNANFLWEKTKGLFGLKKTEGIYKMKISDVRGILGGKNHSIEKLNDFPIKNDLVYSFANILNMGRKILPSHMFHMVYFRVKK